MEDRAGTGHGGKLSGSGPPEQRRGPPGLLAACWGLQSHRDRSSLSLGSASAMLPKPVLLGHILPRWPRAPLQPDKDERCLLTGLWRSPPGASLSHYQVVRVAVEVPPRNPISGLVAFKRRRRLTAAPMMTADDRDTAALPDEERLPAELMTCPFVGHVLLRGHVLLSSLLSKTCPLCYSESCGMSGRASTGLRAQTRRGTWTPRGGSSPRPRLVGPGRPRGRAQPASSPPIRPSPLLRGSPCRVSAAGLRL